LKGAIVFTVRLTRVPENGVLTQEAVRLSSAELGLSEHFDPAGVSASWELTRMMGKVYGKVRVEGVLKLNCGRCLRDFSSPARTEFAVLFEPRARASTRSGEAKASPEDEEEDDRVTVYFDGEEMPLGEELRQELELAVPFNALCREQCGGLCVRCGANLNDGPCACSKIS
jgi:uncharacterized protein